MNDWFKQVNTGTIPSRVIWKIVVPVFVLVTGTVLAGYILDQDNPNIQEQVPIHTGALTETTTTTNSPLVPVPETYENTTTPSSIPVSQPVSEGTHASTYLIHEGNSYTDSTTGLVVGFIEFKGIRSTKISVRLPHQESKTYEDITVGRLWTFDHAGVQYELVVSEVSYIGSYIEITLTKII